MSGLDVHSWSLLLTVLETCCNLGTVSFIDNNKLISISEMAITSNPNTNEQQRGLSVSKGGL